MGREEELVRALVLCYGELPPFWRSDKLQLLYDKLLKLPGVRPGYPMPFSAYLVNVTSDTNLAKAMYANCILSDKSIEEFTNRCPEMDREATVLATVDARTFNAEVDAFDSIEDAIVNPHLEVTALYRYMLAVKHSYLSLITDKLFDSAKMMLRLNPYKYFSYGDAYIDYMPLTWEEL